MLHLKPSEIYYSQDAISARFGRSTVHNYVSIGKTLDDLCEGNISVSDIPKINVLKKGDDGKWYTVDNRRLWIFRHLQGAGKCTVIPCEEIEYSILYERKFDSTNGGVTVRFLYGGDPEGDWYKRITPANPEPQNVDTTPEQSETDEST